MTREGVVGKRPISIAVSVVMLITAIVGAWRAVQPAWNAPAPTPANSALVPLQDFRDALYFPIRAFLAGGDPYRPETMLNSWPVRQILNLYQPYHLILHMPFALGSFHADALAFTAFALGLLVLLAWMAATQFRRFVRLPAGPVIGVVAAALLWSQLGKAQLYLGQINPLVAVAFAATLIGRRSHPAWAAIALAIAWIKPQFGFPLVVLLLARGSWRVAAGGTLLAALSSAPVVVLLAVRDGGLGGFVTTVRENLAYSSSVSYGAVDAVLGERVDISAVVFRVTSFVPPEALVLVVVLTVAAFLTRRLDRSRNEGLLTLSDLVVGVSTIVCVVHQPGDLIIAYPAAIGVAGWWWSQSAHRRSGILLLGLILLAIPFFHLNFVDTFVLQAFGKRVAVTIDGFAIVIAWIAIVIAATTLARAGREVGEQAEVSA